MKIQFLGAVRTVTGSKTLIEVGNFKFLVDCGLFQGLKELREKNWEPLPVNAREIDAVILTHAHIDHTGYLPALVKQGFTGPIYASEETIALTSLLLRDSAYIQMEDAARANKHGYSKHTPAKPLYTIEEAEAVDQYYVKIQPGKRLELTEDVFVQFSRSGHILGAMFVQLYCENQTILFSGDMGRPNDPLLPAPAPLNYTDFLVLESTYGDRVHHDEDPKEKLAEVINQTVSRGGTVLIPAFAVERTQMLLYFISCLVQQGDIPDVPIFLDSPLAISTTKLFRKYAKQLSLSDDELERLANVAQCTQTQEESKAIDRLEGPKIIISASGMVTGGRILHHLKVYGNDARNTVLLTGFQAPGTRGEALLMGKKSIKIHGEMFPINAEVKHLRNTSSHADQTEILAWLGNFKTPISKIFINHGEYKPAEALKAAIEEQYGTPCMIPEPLQIIEV